MVRKIVIIVNAFLKCLFFTVTPTGYHLGVPGLRETGITQDHEINSIAIVSQNENSKPIMFFKLSLWH